MSKKFYKSRMRSNKITYDTTSFVVEVTEEFDKEWLEMCRQGGWEYPEDPIEMYLDNYLKRHRKKNYSQKPSEKVERIIRVRNYNVQALRNLARHKRKPVEHVIREIMTKFKYTQEKRGHYFKLLEEDERSKNKDVHDS